MMRHNKMNKKYLCLLLTSVFLANYGLSKSIPKGSRFDVRIKSQAYNEQDVTVVKVSLGRVNSLIFAQEEDIESAVSGFNDGWDIQINRNILYLKPILPSNDLGINSEKLLKNNYWNTNLLVKTNKNFYVIDLFALPENAIQESAFVVKFNYPQEIARNKKRALALAERERENKEIKKTLNALQIPRNWNYRTRIASNSKNIAPSFVYDDGTNTYLGFTKEKSIPSVFLQNDNQEILVNTVIKNYNAKYKLLVINGTNPAYVLRSGKKVVGILNKGFGKNFSQYQNTNSPNVERVLNER
ncbi:MAG: hypothetical protein GKC53_05460 [Neisseriaceae bacterium]|nr:MAG: hypothetical protein GKC53_05460 [Neisseriaceae bacterium]